MSGSKTSIAIAADHAGFDLKNRLAAWLREQGHDILDLGTDSDVRVDYPDYGYALARAVAGGKAQKGIAVCGSGIGISIALNRDPAIRAAVCGDVTAARFARLHNDANVLCLGARFVGEQVALDCAQAFLSTAFEGGRHACRVEKLGAGRAGQQEKG